MKRRGPGQGKLTYGGLSGALNGAGARTGAGAEGKKKNSPAPGRGPGRGGELGRGPAGYGAPEAP